MLAEAVERGAIWGEWGGELKVLVFVDEEGGGIGGGWRGVEEGVTGGTAGDSEAEWGGVKEG